MRPTIGQYKLLKHYTSMTHGGGGDMPKWRDIRNNAVLTRQRGASWWSLWRCLRCGWPPRSTSRQTDLPLCLPVALKKKKIKLMSHTKRTVRLEEIRIHWENYSLLGEPERKLLSRLPCTISTRRGSSSVWYTQCFYFVGMIHAICATAWKIYKTKQI